MTNDAVPVTAEIDEAKVGRRMLVMVPRPNALVITDCAKEAACELIGKDTYGKPVWTVDTISPENRVVQAFARFERDILARHRGSTAVVDDLPRLDAGLIEAAMIAHYGKSSAGAGIDGLDLTVNDHNWSFREGFTRMWAGVRKELKRLASLSQTPATPNVSADPFGLTDDEAWEQLVNFDDRTSPAEYPDMALITREELSHFMRSSAVCELGDDPATPMVQEGLREALAEAYRKGATDVHNYWVNNPGEPPQGDPEFGESASDYASAALDIFDSSARALSATPAQEGEQ